MYSGKTIYAWNWVTKGSQTVSLGVLPVGAYVVRAHLEVTQAFNSDGTDEITIGYASDPDAFATATAVNTTGVKSVTLGSGIGYQTASSEILAYYAASGSQPTTGKAVVVLEYFIGSRQP